MIPSLPINDRYQTDPCWLGARLGQARIRILNSPISVPANSARNSQRAHLQQLANPHWAAKSSLDKSPSHLVSTAPALKSP
jgi:hypothetical protein